ncbi:TnsD family transposase [Pseudomonas laurylsulfatiphila]|uniref:TnsD family transposase n=1 Tax=Pseudomonas laurylsulfatiphila TaxID=2011015 RepID=UPI0021600CEC|nr:TnsD family transposase [Pseudomonas laurylsulfatiphila]UVM05100.1 TnsD family transposase [Pseudomonas laurylsulfatiphila]
MQPRRPEYPSASGLGDSLSIMREHTILPVFFPFQSDQQIAAVFQTIKSAQIGSIKYRLGLLTGRFGAEHPLKACIACMSHDQTSHGTAYWHLSHQYPGVVLCPIHGLMLRESTINRQWSGSFQWVLPSEASLAAATSPVPSATAQKALQQLGKGVLDLASCGDSRRFHPMTVRSVYKEALVQLGISEPERISASIDFAEYSSQLQPYPPLTSLPTTVQRAEAFISQLTRNPRGHCHPLKHLTLITWLFGRLDQFIEAYDRLDIDPHQQISQAKYKSNAKAVMVGATFIEKVADKKNLRKPKKIKPQIRTAILECLRNGNSKESICSKFGISICTVNRLLRSEPAVAKSRTELHRRSALLKYRAEWQATVLAHSDTTAKSIRLVIPSTYAWLYRNDQNWLLTQTHNLPSGRRGNYSNIDWHERDCKLADLVIKALSQSSKHQLNLDKKYIYRLIPALSRSLENKGYYLKTRNLLSKILQNN